MAPEFIVLKGELQDFKSMKVVPFQIVIKDGYAVASFSDPYLARKMVAQENRHGNNNIRYSKKINSAIEKFEGRKKEEIAKIIGKKLNNSGAKIHK